MFSYSNDIVIYTLFLYMFTYEVIYMYNDVVIYICTLKKNQLFSKSKFWYDFDFLSMCVRVCVCVCVCVFKLNRAEPD